MTFTKSYTTRRSHPMIRSRLRSPMSKSTTATRFPRCASPHAMLADVVVFPTPPLPEVTTIISANAGISYEKFGPAGLALERSQFTCRMTVIEIFAVPSGADAGEMQLLACEPCLYGLARKLGGNRLENAKYARDRDELGMKFLAEHARGELTACPRHCAPTKRAVDMEAAVRHDLRAGTDSGRDDEIAVARINTLPGTHGLILNQSGEARSRRFRRRCHRLRGRCSRLGGRNVRNRLARRPKTRQHGKVEAVRDRFHFRGLSGQSDHQHPGPADRVDHGSNLGDVRRVRERAEIEANRRSAKEVRRGRDAPGQLVQDGARVRGSDADLYQTHLSIANIDNRLRRGGWRVDIEFQVRCQILSSRTRRPRAPIRRSTRSGIWMSSVPVSLADSTKMCGGSAARPAPRAGRCSIDVRGVPVSAWPAGTARGWHSVRGSP